MRSRGATELGRAIWTWLAVAAAVVGLTGSVPAAPSRPAAVSLTVLAPPTAFYVPERQGCDGSDVPDAPLRAIRTQDGSLRVFGLHYTNHTLVGPNFDTLTIDCRSVLPSRENPDPAAYDDRSWIAATWTADGRRVSALVHHEYQANSHPGRCRFPDYMQCWFNTIVAVQSTDGGATFAPMAPRVVASAPFGQSVEQGRHRGFFNPSNIFGDGRFTYMMASTTGWGGQPAGACLFRTATPDDPATWRAYDGTGFTIRYQDPYTAPEVPSPRPCLTLPPFSAPVGSVVRQRGRGLWLAVFQAQKDPERFPVSGIYVSSSRDLLHWGAPRLLVPGTTNYENPCTAGGQLIAYPSLLDPEAAGRNFDDVGQTADLFYATMAVDGCTIGRRVLMRQRVEITDLP